MSVNPVWTIFCLFLLALCSGLMAREVYYVIPSPSDQCRAESCLTLSQLANISNSYIKSNTTLIFLPGNHSLESTFVIANISMFSMIPNFTNLPRPAIICNHYGNFEFVNVHVVHISDISFIQCAGNRANFVYQFILNNSEFTGRVNHTRIGYAAMEFNNSMVFITASSFSFNCGGKLLLCPIYDHAYDAYYDNDPYLAAGGAILSRHSHVTISESMFKSNSAQLGGAIFSEQGSNIIIMKTVFQNHGPIVDNIDNEGQCISFSGSVLYASDGTAAMIHDSYFTDNEKVIFAAHGVNIEIIHSQFINNSEVIHVHCYPDYGSASISIIHSKICCDRGNVSILIYNGEINITHSQLFNNSQVLYSHESTCEIFHSQFIDNIGNGAMMNFFSSTVDVTNSHFINNANTLHDGSGGVFLVRYCSDVHISHCQFINNSAHFRGGVASIEFSFINFQVSESRFINNSAANGGTIDIQMLSHILIINSSFEYNSAENGGAIYGDISRLTIMETNFRSNKAISNGGIIHIKHFSTVIMNRSHFENNTAGNAGGVVTSRMANITVIGCRFNSNSAGHNGGVFSTYLGYINITENAHYHSNTAKNSGGVLFSYHSIINISGCHFSRNAAVRDGGVINAYQGSLITDKANFSHNTAKYDGGVIYARFLHITATGTSYNSNKAFMRGGVWFIDQSILAMSKNVLSESEAGKGGVVFIIKGNITMVDTSFVQSKASSGGALNADSSNMFIQNSLFNYNSVDDKGGAWFLEDSKVSLKEVIFIRNHAKNGAAVYSRQSEINSYGSLFISCNKADTGVFYLLESSAYFYGEDTVFIDNYGSCLLLNSTAVFKGTTNFLNCSEPERSLSATEMQEGGGLTIVRSYIIFEGAIIFTNNHAQNGGAMYVKESKVYVSGETTLANNTADNAGGGVYLYMSELCCMMNSSLKLMGNKAGEKGGAVHSLDSSINVKENFRNNNITHEVISSGCLLYFADNEANKGGALSLEKNARINILKCMPHCKPLAKVTFNANLANYGGAIYVEDGSNQIMCTSLYEVNDCFFQILEVYNTYDLISSNFSDSFKNCSNVGDDNYHFFFSNNYARLLGSSLYGGLIGQCRLKYPADLNKHKQETFVNGSSYMINITNINISDVSSIPVQLCFCKHDLLDCSYSSDRVRVKKGERFSVELMALDQVHQPINATILSSLTRAGGGLGEGQTTQTTSRTCTAVYYNLFSPYDSEELTIHAKGPCKDLIQSQRTITVQFSGCDFCPIGFEKEIDKNTACECICDTRLRPYITQCNTSTEVLVRKGNFWITYINTGNDSTSGYLIYPNCPLNYCLKSTLRVEINLNIPSGADAQCVNGRSGMLCGTCQSNLSLSLGSSDCIPCSNNWAITIAVLIASLLAGIALVAFLLMLNLTVAVGTLNGIFFYVDIVAANKSTFLPFSKPNFVTVFISWLNLEIGFNICLFEGMNAYWKTLLGLAFPLYIIFLVIIIIVISEKSTKFVQLVTKKNPVATLATLILLSYTKFLNTVISSLSYATLVYPDGSHRKVWLPDANIEYLKGKHIALFVIGIVILLAGVIYTALLFSWQWLLYHQDKAIFKWTKYQPLCHFLEPYHAPYTIEQRYWTGLLLLVRVIIYTVSALNETGDPRVSFVAINILVGLLPLVKNVLERKIYKQKLVDIMEMITYFNIISFAALTWYTYDASKNQAAIAYISVMITFCLLLAVCVFHIFRYTALFSYARKKLDKNE